MNFLCLVMRLHFLRMANVCILSEENLHATITHQQDSRKMNVFSATSMNHISGPFFFEGNVTCDVYLQIIDNCIMDELFANEHGGFMYQQDSALLY